MSRFTATALNGLVHAVSHAKKCPCTAGRNALAGSTHRVNQLHSDPSNTDYAFEMATSNIRFGRGCTSEVGFDAVNLGMKKVMVVTDRQVGQTIAVERVVSSLKKQNVEFDIYDEVRVEPTDNSFKRAIDFALKGSYGGFIAVGGGSVMDTAKAANLYSTHPTDDFLTYVNAPVGKGKPIPGPLKPLIAVPTTAGTGSETTGVAIFDLEDQHFKTGIASRLLKPTLGVVDPDNTRSLPARVAVYSGFDVLAHSLESWTAVPYHMRDPRPTSPALRPAYQGANPISDGWSMMALRLLTKFMPRAVLDPDDVEARAQMLLAATYAGIGFGNAGVHLCHGMSYPVAGMARLRTREPGYDLGTHPIIPHGLSVVVHAPAVFRFTAFANPQRHLAAAEAFGVDVSRARPEDAGKILSDVLIDFMQRMNVPNGLRALGFNSNDIPALVYGTLPQERVTRLSPRHAGEEELALLFENSMTLW